MPMSRLMTLMLMLIGMVMVLMRRFRMRMNPISIGDAIGKLGQMKMRKVITVMMVIEDRGPRWCPAGVKEDQHPGARPGKDRLPIPDPSARPFHHQIIRLRSNIGLHRPIIQRSKVAPAHRRKLLPNNATRSALTLYPCGCQREAKPNPAAY